MTEVIAPPDVAALVISYLNSVLTEPVSGKVPNPRPAAFVRVTQVPSDGFEGRVLFRARVLVEAWGMTEGASYDLAAAANGRLTAGPWHVDAGGPGQFPTDSTGMSKYAFTADVYARGTLI